MMNLTNMRIGKRLGVGFGIAIVLTVVIAITGWWASQSINTAADKALSEGSKALLTKTAMLDNVTIQTLVLRITNAPDAGRRQQYTARLIETRQTLKSELAEIESIAASETSKRLAQEFTAGVTTQRETNNQIMELVNNGKRDEAMQLVHGEAGTRMASTAAVAQQLADWEVKKRDDALQEKAAVTLKMR
ncbi:MAG TPA: MCP four helix bundle domain-containing protein, partial [Candidatus Binatia bacterium]|nr:MCP four helix bundle domain-containing protein [Candidatus Binatia bacterium]